MESKNEKEKNLLIVILLAIIFIFIVLIGFGCTRIVLPMIRYNKAQEFAEDKEYDLAYNAYVELYDYKDSRDKAIETIYAKAKSLENKENYLDAAKEYDRIIDFSDSKNRIVTCINEDKYHKGIKKYKSEEYEEAIQIFSELEDYSDSVQYLTDSYYGYAKRLYDIGDYDEAVTYFTKCQGYKDSDELIKDAKYNTAINCINLRDYSKAISLLNSLGNYKNSRDELSRAKYSYVNDNLDSSNQTTYVYLKELCSLGYRDSNSIYKNLYKWHANLVFNTSEYDSYSSMSRISRYSTVYCHVNLSGGEPGGSTSLSYKLIWPDGSSDRNSWDGVSRVGNNIWFNFWYNSPNRGRTGTATAYVYDGSGNQIGSGTVSITN